MPVVYPLTEGFDPTGQTQVTVSQLLQMIRQATPAADFGVVLHGSTTPDVASNAWMARCVWIDTTTPTKPIWKWYNSSTPAWEEQEFDAIDGASLTNGTVTLAKLSVSGLTALHVLRVNAGGTAIEAVDLITSIVTNTLPIDKLVKGANSTFFKTNSGGTIEWSALSSAEVNAAIAVASIAVNKLAFGTANYALMTNAAGNAVEWRSAAAIVTIGSIINATLGNQFPWTSMELRPADHIPLMDPTGAFWTSQDKDLFGIQKANHQEDLGTATFPITWAHGLGATPTLYFAEFVCTTAEYGYSIGNRIQGAYGSGGVPAAGGGLTLSVDGTNVVASDGTTKTFSIAHKTTGALNNITNGSWDIRLTAAII